VDFQRFDEKTRKFAEYFTKNGQLTIKVASKQTIEYDEETIIVKHPQFQIDNFLNILNVAKIVKVEPILKLHQKGDVVVLSGQVDHSAHILEPLKGMLETIMVEVSRVYMAKLLDYLTVL
jgi:hypothetical protein